MSWIGLPSRTRLLGKLLELSGGVPRYPISLVTSSHIHQNTKSAIHDRTPSIAESKARNHEEYNVQYPLLPSSIYYLTPPLSTLPLHLPVSAPQIYEDEPAAPAIEAAFASATFLFSPCLPFCPLISYPSPHCLRNQRALTFHFANLNSISPRRSATNRLSSFRLRRTTRAATERYLL
jgi:hypothetical protein